MRWSNWPRSKGCRSSARPAVRAGVVSFVMDGVHPHDIGTILDDARDRGSRRGITARSRSWRGSASWQRRGRRSRRTTRATRWTRWSKGCERFGGFFRCESQRSDEFFDVASLDEVPEMGVLGVEGPDGRAICLVRFEGHVTAFADECTHQAFPLSAGEVRAGRNARVRVARRAVRLPNGRRAAGSGNECSHALPGSHRCGSRASSDPREGER